MKFICNQIDLDQALQAVSQNISKKAANPVLLNFLFVANDNYVDVHGYDLKTYLTYQLPVDLHEGGSIALPAELLASFIARLPAGEMTIEVKQEIASISCGESKLNLHGIDGDQFPIFRSSQDLSWYSLPADRFLAGLEATIFAASKDDFHSNLGCVNFNKQHDWLEMVATDGHRLSVFGFQATDDHLWQDTEDFSISLPISTASEIKYLITSKTFIDESLLFAIDGDFAFFKQLQNEWEIGCHLIAGDFPQYKNLFPATFKQSPLINRQVLMDALGRISLLASHAAIKFDFVVNSNGSRLIVSAESGDIGNAKETLSVDLLQESIQVNFNCKYLLEGLKSLNSTEVAINLNKPNNAVTITPVGGDKISYLIMPLLR